MKKVTIATWMALILGCASLGSAVEAADDSIYYNRVGFYHEKGSHRTVNYLRGTWVPINTKIQLLKKGGSKISIRIVDTGESVSIVNKKSYSGVDIDGLFDRMFSREETDLSKFSPEQVQNIKAGNYEPGMTKEEVILSIGYPPAHHTPTLDKNAWRYWRSKFDTVLLYFKGDVLDHLVN